MNYLVSNFDFKIKGQKEVLKANVPYCVYELSDELSNCELQQKFRQWQYFDINFYEIFSFVATYQYVNLISFKQDKICFLNFPFNNEQDFRSFEFLNNPVNVFIDKKLIINFKDKQLVNIEIDNLAFDRFYVDEDICFIYFKGTRQFLVCFDKDKLIWADFFDEYNSAKGEKQFLKHLHDGLNHGRVLSLKEGKSDKYLVYLDDFEMNLKPEFVALVFMDCFAAGNFNYCVNLLDKSIAPQNAKDIKNFLPEFDRFFPFGEKVVVLFKKNALVGICEFEIVEDKIVNIILN